LPNLPANLNPLTMKKRILLGLAALLSGTSPLFAQHSGNAVYGQPRYERAQAPNLPADSVLVLEARVLANLPADGFQAVLAVSQPGETLNEAQERLNNRLGAFTKALGRLGLAPTDIYVDVVSQVPTFAWETEQKLFSRNYVEVPKGFSLQKNLHVAYRQDAQLEAIMAEAAKSEIYDLVTVRYLVDRPTALADTLRDLAWQVIKRKRARLEQQGLSLASRYQTLAEDLRVLQPAERYQAYEAHSSTNLALGRRPGKVETAEKATTFYYEPAPGEEYDQVLNPNPLAPTVQFSLVLRVKYVLRTSR
jgi:uncharacterized protein YggE